MIRIERGDDIHRYDKYRQIWPPGPGPDSRCCKAEHPDCRCSCARDGGHKGPHRRLIDTTLYLWCDSAEKEAVLEMSIRLDIIEGKK